MEEKEWFKLSQVVPHLVKDGWYVGRTLRRLVDRQFASHPGLVSRETSRYGLKNAGIWLVSEDWLESLVDSARVDVEFFRDSLSLLDEWEQKETQLTKARVSQLTLMDKKTVRKLDEGNTYDEERRIYPYSFARELVKEELSKAEKRLGVSEAVKDRMKRLNKTYGQKKITA